MKNARQEKIIELIEKYDIDTQQTLKEKLIEEGYDVTQTTISRDIGQLKLVKGMTAKGTYKYVLPTAKRAESAPVMNSAITDSIVSIVAAENIVVVKTYPGMANAICVFIDGLGYEEILGSVAGDDTVLIVVKDDEAALDVVARMKNYFGQ